MTAEEQLKILNTKLEEFVKAYKGFKEVGIDEEIIIAYIFYKTRLPRKDILKILESQEEFYKKLTNDLVLDALEDKEKPTPNNIGPYIRPNPNPFSYGSGSIYKSQGNITINPHTEMTEK